MRRCAEQEQADIDVGARLDRAMRPNRRAAIARRIGLLQKTGNVGAHSVGECHARPRHCSPRGLGSYKSTSVGVVGARLAGRCGLTGAAIAR
jgi:hypothetical protein